MLKLMLLWKAWLYRAGSMVFCVDEETMSGESDRPGKQETRRLIRIGSMIWFFACLNGEG